MFIVIISVPAKSHAVNSKESQGNINQNNNQVSANTENITNKAHHAVINFSGFR
jgi:hypothetical protein